MKVMILSPYGDTFERIVKSIGDEVVTKSILIEPDGVKVEHVEPDYIVMYGHRQVLKDIPAIYKNRIINVHISLLPYNKGSDPNFWSWYDNTPKGVSIHFVDEGIDTGDVIASRSVYLAPEKYTLRTSYKTLHQHAVYLFNDMWPVIRRGTHGLRQGPETGSYHTKAQLEPLWKRLSLGWDSSVFEVSEMGRIDRDAQAT